MLLWKRRRGVLTGPGLDGFLDVLFGPSLIRVGDLLLNLSLTAGLLFLSALRSGCNFETSAGT